MLKELQAETRSSRDEQGIAASSKSSRRLLIASACPTERGTLAGAFAASNETVTAVADLRNALVDTFSTDCDTVVLGHSQTGPLADLEALKPILARCSVLHIVSDASQCEQFEGHSAVASDFVVRPVDTRELIARVNALRRRAPSLDASAGRRSEYSRQDERYIDFAGYRLASDTRRVVTPSGDAIVLQRACHELLEIFLSNAQRVLTRDRIMTLLGEDNRANCFDRAVDMRVQRLRSALGFGKDGRPDVITTHRGIGYIFDAKVTHI